MAHSNWKHVIMGSLCSVPIKIWAFRRQASTFNLCIFFNVCWPLFKKRAQGYSLKEGTASIANSHCTRESRGLVDPWLCYQLKKDSDWIFSVFQMEKNRAISSPKVPSQTHSGELGLVPEITIFLVKITSCQENKSESNPFENESYWAYQTMLSLIAFIQPIQWYSIVKEH